MRAFAAAIGLALAAVAWWAAAMHVGNRVPERLGDLLAALSLVVPTLAWAAALVVAAGTVTRSRLSAGAAGVAAYAVLGALYALARGGGYFDGSPLEVLVWPTLFLWQDACGLGAWPCPSG